MNIIEELVRDIILKLMVCCCLHSIVDLVVFYVGTEEEPASS